MTTLKGFVSEALQQCLEGILDAQASSTVGEYVAPFIGDKVNVDPRYEVAWHGHGMLTTLRFDIAVTADSTAKAEDGGKMKVGLSVVSASLSGSDSTTDRFENVSRVKFAVHIRLPQPAEKR